MSKLVELIEELCPEGVKYKPLGEVVQIRNGRDWKSQEPGEIPVYGSGGRMEQSVAVASSEGPSVLLPRKGSLEVQYVEEPIWNVDTVFTTVCAAEVLNTRFFYFVMESMDLGKISTSATRPSLTQSALRKLLIPVPPLELQQEVVRVLDAFTDLEQSLVAELDLRKKQLMHLRREAVASSQSKSGKKLLLGEAESQGLVAIGRGKVISKKDIAKIPGDYPVYSSSGTGTGEFGRYGKYMFDDERITWSVDGGGRLFYRPEHRYSVTNVSGWMTVDTSVFRTKYLYYVLLSQWEEEHFDYTRKAHPSVIRNVYEFSIPPLEAQDRVISTLNALECLIQSIEQEIALRRKQYEFYRDELLHFKPKGA